MSFLKKGLSIILGTTLVLGIVAVSQAETKVSGNLKLGYNVVNSDNDDYYVSYKDASGNKIEKLKNKSQDGGELKIYFDNKFDDNINTRITLKGYLDSVQDSDRSKPYNYIDEYYVNDKTKYGTFKAGKWAFKPKGKIDVLSTAFGDFKAEEAVQWTYNFRNGMNVGLWTVLDRSSLAEVVGDHAYVATLGWSNKNLMTVDVNLVDTGNEEDIEEVTTGSGQNKKSKQLASKYGEGTQLGYTANVVFTKFGPVIQPFIHYSKDDVKGELNEKCLIVGFCSTVGPWYFLIECNLEDDYVLDGTSVKSDMDRAYGCKIKYNFKKKMNLEWKYYKYDEKIGKDKNEIGLNIPF